MSENEIPKGPVTNTVERLYQRTVARGATVVLYLFLTASIILLIIFTLMGIIGLVKSMLACCESEKHFTLNILHSIEYFLVAPLPFISIFSIGKIIDVSFDSSLPITYDTAKTTFFSSVIGVVILELAARFINYEGTIGSSNDLLMYTIAGFAIIASTALIYFVISKHQADKHDKS